MIKAQIISQDGKTPVKIDEDGNLVIVQMPHPPLSETVYALPFRSYFTSDAGGIKMNVNGSATSTDFYLSASEDFDIHVKYVSIEIGDGGSPSLNLFGALPALTNGVGFYYFTNNDGLYELHEGIKTNKEFIRIGTDTAAIGTGIEAFLADVSGGGTEKSYLPSIDFEESYGMRFGLRLRKGTKDKIIFRISDDLTGLTTFNAVGYGIRI